MNIEELENLVETATEKEVVDLAKAELQKIKLKKELIFTKITPFLSLFFEVL